MTVFRSLSSDAFYSGQYTNYATALATGNYMASTSYIRVGQRYDSGWYIVDRGMLVFDTSAIPDTDTVTAVTLGLCIAVDGTTASDFILYIYRYNWNPAASTDNVYDMGAAGASDGQPAVKETPEADVTGKSAGDWITISGLTTSWINKTGYTCYALRSSRDVNANAPSGLEYLSFYAGDHAESYRPYLDVQHGAGGSPRVTRIYAQGVLGASPLNPL